MPHSIIWEPDGLLRTFYGTVSAGEILESNLELYGDLRFNKAKYIINDFSGITDHSIEYDQIQAFALSDETISREKHAFNIALVVPQPSDAYLAHRLSELMSGKPFKYATFQSVDDARVWVDSIAN